LVQTEEYRIRTSEIDKNKELTTVSMIQLMQETSMQQVIDLKASVWDLEERKISWVLLRKEMILYKKAGLNDIVTIKTYPTGFKKIFAYRDYKAYNNKGELLAQAASTWTLINTETRRPEVIPEDMFKYKADPSIEYLAEAKNRLDLVKDIDYTNEYKINYLNLDWNGHVNNVFIAKCILESMPDAYFERTLNNFSIHFKTESILHDHLRVDFSKIDSSNTAHCITRKNDKKIIALANCTWEG
jgi:acyl-ACP thioesterase